MNLNQRQQKILQATIRHYIITAEPVGSKALVDEYNLQVSSATIRNSFTLLEKAGLLYQPHTSAGRVPSDSGYRHYVDQLLQPDVAMAKQAESQLSSQLDWEKWSLEALLNGAAQILATLSGYIAIITPPVTNSLTVQHLQLVQIADGRVMAIVVFDSYQSQSVLLDLLIAEEELQQLSHWLNRQTCGRSTTELLAMNWSIEGGSIPEVFLSENRFAVYAPVIRNLLLALQQRNRPSTQVMMRGFAGVLRQPEFAELQQVQNLLQLLEAESAQLWQSILPGEAGAAAKISIRIGTENSWEPMHICTLVSSTYAPTMSSIGSVSLLGPKRMLYENAIPLVETTADYLATALSAF
jgi:heat-inducible transcriptional repressor